MRHEEGAPRWHPRGFNNGLIFGATFHGVSRLPAWVTYPIGHVGSWLAYRFQTTGRAALIENLRGAFPDRPDAELRRLALAAYRSYARDTIDFMRSLARGPDHLRRLFGRIDTAAFDAVLADGRGALAVSAHFGNWELGGVLLRRLTSHRLTVVVMREPSAEVSRRRRAFRDSLGIETIEIRQGLQTGLRIREQLARNGVVAMLVDRHLGRDRVPVTFFGRRAYFLRTPAVIAAFTGAPLVPVSVFRAGDGRLTVETGSPVYVDVGGDREAAVQRAMQAMATFFEARVRRHPESWYQFYSFWDAQNMSGAESA
jgi:KDO2-lipid IV(A) lauroyltransferase